MNRAYAERALALFLLLNLLIVLRPQALAKDAVTETRKTLLDQAVFTGVAEPGDVLACTVYTFRNSQEQILLFQSRQVIGSSGLYSLSVPLPLIGSQYVMLDVGEERTIYEYTRYSRSLGAEISDYQLNIYEFLQQQGAIRPGGSQ